MTMIMFTTVIYLRQVSYNKNTLTLFPFIWLVCAETNGEVGLQQHQMVTCQIVQNISKFNNITRNKATFLIPKLSVSNLILDKGNPELRSLLFSFGFQANSGRVSYMERSLSHCFQLVIQLFSPSTFHVESQFLAEILVSINK